MYARRNLLHRDYGAFLPVGLWGKKPYTSFTYATKDQYFVFPLHIYFLFL